MYYSISLLHSLISSMLFVLALAKTPQVFEDFHGKNQLIELACCFTIGFYIFDIYNIVCNNPNNYLQWVLNCPIFLVFFSVLGLWKVKEASYYITWYRALSSHMFFIRANLQAKGEKTDSFDLYEFFQSLWTSYHSLSYRMMVIELSCCFENFK